MHALYILCWKNGKYSNILDKPQTVYIIFLAPISDSQSGRFSPDSDLILHLILSLESAQNRADTLTVIFFWSDTFDSARIILALHTSKSYVDSLQESN